MTNNFKGHILFPIYLLGFFLAFHTALPAYINSSFLNVFVSEESLGLVYLIASIFTILGFVSIPSVLRRFGNYRTALFLVVAQILILLGLAFLNSPVWLILLFIVNLFIIPLIYFSVDIFLEGFSSNRQTGSIRGFYLTFVNIAWVISALITGLVLTDGDYWKIYLASAVLLLPVLLILVLTLKNFPDSRYQKGFFRQTIRLVWSNKNILNVFFANFLLFFFYSWMVIYMPLYLKNEIGFSRLEIGQIFAIMLLPFVFVQLPLGRLADRKFGEKELLSIGFVIIAVATSLIAFINSDSFWVWASLLFVTRIGASVIEIMCDTYFFKKVSSLDANVTDFFRMANPLAYILGPLVATLILGYSPLDLKYLFLILGLIMLTGLKFSLSLKDTK